jgi:SAM-dependent methyltransferase
MNEAQIFRFERLRLQRMAALAKRSGTIADVGFRQCPNPFLESGNVIGIDPNATESDLAPNYSDFFSGTLLGYLRAKGEEQLDAVLAGELIEHLEAPLTFLRECYLALKPGGRLVLSTPNPNSFIERLLTLTLSRRYFYTIEHISLIPQRWLVRMMEMAGFSNVRLYSGGFPLPFIGLIPFPRPWCYQTIATGEKRLANSC